MAPSLAAQRAPQKLIFRAQQLDGTWKAFAVDGGLLQGRCDGNPCFRLVLAVIWVQVTDRGFRAYIAQVAVWLYVNDIIDQLDEFLASCEIVLPGFA